MGSHTSAENGLAPPPTPSYPSFANDDQRPEMFSPRGSPPLIIAFLAIGLFTIAMLLVCGWQRVRVASGWILPTAAATRAGGRGNFKGERLGEKPQLWDVRIAYPGLDTRPEDNGGLHGNRNDGEVQKGTIWKDITVRMFHSASAHALFAWRQSFDSLYLPQSIGTNEVNPSCPSLRMKLLQRRGLGFRV